MISSALKTAGLAILLVLPVASRVNGQAPPAPPAPPAAPAPPAPPAAPAPPAETHRQKVIVDGDRVTVWEDGEEPDLVVEAPEEDAHHPMRFHFRDHGRGYIGLRPIEMTPELRQHFGAPKDAGVLVGSVEKDGPAARAGLQVGDIVTAVDGDRVESTGDLVRAIRHQKEGAKVKLDLVRGKATRSLTVTVGQRREDFELGDLDRRFRGFGKGIERMMPRLERLPERLEGLPDFHGIQERLQDLEHRLKELEGRLKK